MTVRLRMVLDRAVSGEGPDVTEAASGLLANLVATAPRGCEVVGIAPRPSSPEAGRADDLGDVWHAAVPRRELAAAWRVGATLGGAGGMIHSPTLMAPLVRHDRAHDHDQTVVTLWSLEPWTAPERLQRSEVAWQRAMLKRALRFADAVVVPTHAMAAELDGIASFGGRIRVIAGAPPEGFRVPDDAAGRARTLALPERYVVAIGRVADREGLGPAFRAAAGVDLDVVVLHEQEEDVVLLIDDAVAAGVSKGRIHTAVDLDAADRAAVLGGAVAVVAASAAPAFPWRVLETFAVGAPLISVRTPQNEELFADGAQLVNVGDSDAFGEALRRLVEDESFAARQRVMSADRARAFSWRDAAERVWQLHAEL